MLRFSCWKYILVKNNDKRIFESCIYDDVRNALANCLFLKSVNNSDDDFTIIQEPIYKNLDFDIIDIVGYNEE